VLPVDHHVKKGGNHLGPQIRPWLDVVEECAADVGVFQLDPAERARLLVSDIETTRRIMLEFYHHYKDYSYPLNPLPQLAAASPKLYDILRGTHQHMASQNAQALDHPRGKSAASPSQAKKKKEKVFCSEMVALLYRALQVTGFHEADRGEEGGIHPAEFTPLELEVMDVFKWQRCVYVKANKICLLAQEDHGRTVYPLK
jgi:hypothetical protein